MFKGVIHANARKVVPELVKLLPERLVNICSGNFTLETTFRMNGFKGQIESCDVSLYSCALGAYYAGQDFRCEIKNPELTIFNPLLTDPHSKAAVVAVLLEMSELHKRNNDFQKRMWDAYLGRFEQLVSETKEKLAKKRALVNLNRFHQRDGVEVINDLKGAPGVVIVSSPPTYDGGYEKLYEWVDKTVDWGKPGYTDIGPKEEFAKLILSAGTDWVLFTEDRKPEVEAVIGQPKAQCSRGANKDVLLYTNLDLPVKLIRRTIPVSAEPPWRRLRDKDVIERNHKVGFHKIASGEAAYIRQVYSGVAVDQAQGQFNYAFSVDGKLVGVASFSIAQFDVKVDGESVGGRYIYMMADMPVASERHPRLAKLILSLTKSVEFKHELEARASQAVDYIFTTAFSEHNTSMKYRGVYDMHSRKPKDAKGRIGINYVAKIGEHSARELFCRWFDTQYKPKVKP